MTFLIALVSVLVILLLTGLTIRKSLYFAYLRLKYGKYSTPYVESFKKRFRISPYPESTKDDLFTHMNVFYNHRSNIQKFKADKEVKFYDTNFGTHHRNFARRKIKPDFFTAYRLNGSEIMIPGYNEIINDVDVRVLYFFIDRIFFMGMFYFREIPAGQVFKIVNELKVKYGISSSEKVKDFIIEGTNGAWLNCQDHVFSLSIRYYSFNESSANEVIQKYFDGFLKVQEAVRESFDQANWKTVL